MHGGLLTGPNVRHSSPQRLFDSRILQYYQVPDPEAFIIHACRVYSLRGYLEAEHSGLK